jgi:D-alanyl-D-alanine carboxypeptidase/D-alanyl-D-alanine-endopeptidase (penicillin-binding protein 4)
MQTKNFLFIRLFVFFSFYLFGVSAQTPSLASKIDGLLKDKFYQGATVGISVYDLTNSKSLYQYNDRKLCRPASNMKLLTSAAALQYLTPDAVFHTGLFYTGNIDESGKLEGNIYVSAGFDPELSSADLDTLVSLIKKAGITGINGNIYTDVSAADTLLWGKAWAWDDDMEAFQPYLTPIPVNKGVVKLRIIPASPNRPPVIKTEPESSFIQIRNRAITVWKSQKPAKETIAFNRIYDGKTNIIDISGSIAASAKPHEIKISLKNPNEYFQRLFLEKLRTDFPGDSIFAGGIAAVPADAVQAGAVSRSMKEVIFRLNKTSDNLNAELLVYALGRRAGHLPSSTEKGIDVIRQLITEIGMQPEKYRIVDGSGLSGQNYLSPELMVALLKYMYSSPCFELFKESLPVAGKDGTLTYRMRNSGAQGKISAKTGSITGVCTLSGYATARNGHLLAFSVMIQNFVEKTSFVAGNYMDKICEALVSN